MSSDSYGNGRATRTYLRAYLKLQEAHKLLHKALRARELDEEEEIILLRVEKTEAIIQDALRQIRF